LSHLDALFSLSIVWLNIAFGASATILSGVMARLFGEERTSVITRPSAFPLLRVGVQIIVTGVAEIGRSIHDGAPRL
jgi:multiple antibiotic resistance protein